MEIFVSNLVPASPLATDVVIKKWVVNKDEICVFRNGADLKSRVTTHLGIVTWYPVVTCDPMGIPANKDINTVINHVKACAAILRPDASPVFDRVSRIWRFTENKGCIFLIKNSIDKKIICQVYVKACHQYFQEDFLDCLLSSDRCHPDTRDLIDDLKTQNLDEIINFSNLLTIRDMSIRDSVNPNTMDFHTDQAKIKQEALYGETEHWVNELNIPTLLKRRFIAKNQKAINQRLLTRNIKRKDAFETRSVRCFLLEVEPFSAPSKIDERVLVSQFRWAVTLICRGSCDNNSTSLIVEGLNNGKFNGLKRVKVGEYFMYKVHFAGKIESDIFQKNLEYYQRTEIWKVSSEKVVTMLDNIAEDDRKLKLDEEYIPYDFLGPNEDNPDAHNCFSWLKEHLRKANVVDLETKTFFGFPYRVRNYTKYGNISIYRFKEISFPSPKVAYYNFEDAYDYSEETTLYREEI